MYFYVKNGQILDKKNAITGSWNDPETGISHSNLECLDKEELISIGWWPGSYSNNNYDRRLYQKTGEEYELVDTGEVVVTNLLQERSMEDTLAKARESKLNQLPSWFEAAFQNGYMCPTVGLKMDCNRIDLTNMESLYKYMSMHNMLKTDIRDYDNNFHEVSILDVQSIVSDLIEYGLWIYKRKWQLEYVIKTATTMAQIQGIEW